MERWMTLAEVATYLQVSKDSVYRMAQRGQIPASKVVGQWRFDQQEIDAWMRSERCRSAAPRNQNGEES